MTWPTRSRWASSSATSSDADQPRTMADAVFGPTPGRAISQLRTSWPASKSGAESSAGITAARCLAFWAAKRKPSARPCTSRGSLSQAVKVASQTPGCTKAPRSRTRAKAAWPTAAGMPGPPSKAAPTSSASERPEARGAGPSRRCRSACCVQ